LMILRTALVRAPSVERPAVKFFPFVLVFFCGDIATSGRNRRLENRVDRPIVVSVEQIGGRLIAVHARRGHEKPADALSSQARLRQDPRTSGQAATGRARFPPFCRAKACDPTASLRFPS